MVCARPSPRFSPRQHAPRRLAPREHLGRFLPLLGVGLVLALGLAPASVEAQRLGGSGYVALGSVDLELDALNDRLAAAGLPEVSTSAFALGGGGYGLRGRVLLGGEGHGFLLADETTPDGTTGLRLAGGYGLFLVGWELFRGDRLALYPRGGFGGGGYSLQIGPREVPRFDDVLADPARSTSLTNGGFLTSFGLRAELALGERPRRGASRSGPVIGLEVSTLRGLGPWGWRSEWGEVTRGPDVPLEGAHLRVTLGGGARR